MEKKTRNVTTPSGRARRPIALREVQAARTMLRAERAYRDEVVSVVVDRLLADLMGDSDLKPRPFLPTEEEADESLPPPVLFVFGAASDMGRSVLTGHRASDDSLC